MLAKAECIEKLKSAKQFLSEKYGVRSLLLFGSFARDEQKENSDVDVCVDMNPNLLNRVGIKRHLEQLLNRQVDVICLSPNLNSVLKQQIYKDGILVF